MPRPWYFRCRPSATAAARRPTRSVSPSRGAGASSIELLIPTLHRAVPVAEVDHVLPVAQHLHLDVPRGETYRSRYTRGSENAACASALATATAPASCPAPAPPAARAPRLLRRLDQHRIPDPLGYPGRVLRAPASAAPPTPASAAPPGLRPSNPGLRPRPGHLSSPTRHPAPHQPARQHRQPRRDRVPPRRELVPGRLEHVRARPDEHDARRLARPRQPRVLGQEAVARVDRLRPRRDRGRDHRLHVQVTLRRADSVTFPARS